MTGSLKKGVLDQDLPVIWKTRSTMISVVQEA